MSTSIWTIQQNDPVGFRFRFLKADKTVYPLTSITTIVMRIVSDLNAVLINKTGSVEGDGSTGYATFQFLNNEITDEGRWSGQIILNEGAAVRHSNRFAISVEENL